MTPIIPFQKNKKSIPDFKPVYKSLEVLSLKKGND